MKQRFVRPDHDLGDEQELILRGGDLDPSIIRRVAQRMFDIYGTSGISVFALRGATIDELSQGGSRCPGLRRTPRVDEPVP